MVKWTKQVNMKMTGKLQPTINDDIEHVQIKTNKNCHKNTREKNRNGL